MEQQKHVPEDPERTRLRAQILRSGQYRDRAEYVQAVKDEVRRDRERQFAAYGLPKPARIA